MIFKKRFKLQKILLGLSGIIFFLSLLPVQAVREMPDVDSLVVGAGLSGLTAARKLYESGTAVAVYEARPRLGGRTHTFYYGDGSYVELGGEKINAEHTHLRSLCERQGVSLVEQKVCWPIAIVANDRLLTTDEQISLLREGRELANRWKVELDSGDKRLIDPLRELAELSEDNLVRRLFETYINDEYGMLLEKAPWHTLFLIEHGLDSYEAIIESAQSSLEDELPSTYRMRGGTATLINALAEPLQIHTNHKLFSLRKDHGTHPYVALFFDADEIVEQRAQRVLLTLPFSTLRDVTLDDSLNIPLLQRTAILTLPYGQAAKVVFPLRSRPCERSPYHSTFLDLDRKVISWGTENQSQTSITRVVGGSQTTLLPRRFHGESPYLIEERNEALDPFFSGIQTVFPEAQMDVTRPTLVKTWDADDPFSRGNWSNFTVDSTPQFYDQSTFSPHLRQIGNPVENLFFAGEHTSFDYAGFMEGAVRTGEEAARLMLEGLMSPQWPYQRSF